MYVFSFVKISKEITARVQMIINKFFWKDKKPTIAFSTLVGRKDNDGVGLPCFKTMIEAHRIKCDLQLISGLKPKLWHYYALIDTAGKLRRFAPRLWTNLTSHAEDEKSFFFDVAEGTKKWMSKGGQMIIKSDEQSLYWQLIEGGVFQMPECIRRKPRLDDIHFFKS